jgi:hypothetical protein
MEILGGAEVRKFSSAYLSLLEKPAAQKVPMGSLPKQYLIEQKSASAINPFDLTAVWFLDKQNTSCGNTCLLLLMAASVVWLSSKMLTCIHSADS